MADRPRRAQEVRRLLADARHTEPMPVDVAARLDRVIADLAGQQTAQDHTSGGSVTELAARRRRRVATLLVAAAAVVAAGIGVGQLVGSPTTSNTSAGSSAARGPSAPAPSAGDQQGQESFGRPGSDSVRPRHPSAADSRAGQVPAYAAVRIRSGHFTADAARARRNAVESGALDSVQGTEGAHGSTFVCDRADWGRGTVLPVRYEHLPAVLVLRPPRGATQVVDLFRCGTTDLLRSTTLPSR